MAHMFNFSTRKVGGLRFIKIGRLTISFSVARTYKPMKPAAAPVSPARLAEFATLAR